jgi:hypothetical protein
MVSIGGRVVPKATDGSQHSVDVSVENGLRPEECARKDMSREEGHTLEVRALEAQEEARVLVEEAPRAAACEEVVLAAVLASRP